MSPTQVVGSALVGERGASRIPPAHLGPRSILALRAPQQPPRTPATSSIDWVDVAFVVVGAVLVLVLGALNYRVSARKEDREPIAEKRKLDLDRIETDLDV